MSRLGIYFGPQTINITEVKGKVMLNDIQIPRSAILSGQLLEEKVPEEVKLVTALKEEITKKKIEAKEIVVVLSGKDFIIRSFEVPILSPKELITALNFEVKKYIPFKIEELVSDFQWITDKSTQKTQVLFMGIKKEILEKYISILNKLELKPVSIEYAGFSILKLFNLARIREKGTIAVVGIDLIKNDEINFIILKKGFPLFSRDIAAIEGTEEESNKTEEGRFYTMLDKLKREILISLDYYERKFAGKHPEKLFFIANSAHKINLDIFKELGLGTQLIDVAKVTGSPAAPSLPFIKAYTGALLEVDVGIKINLLSVKERARKEGLVAPAGISFFIARFKAQLKIAVISLLVCIMVYFLGEAQKSPLKKEIGQIRAMRPAVLTVNPDLDYTELNNLAIQYKEKINLLDMFAKRELYLTELLDNIARLMPEGMWLESFSFKDKKEEKKRELVLEANAYLADSNKEVELVNIFLTRLKESPLLGKYFRQMNIVSLERRQVEKDNLTHFVITCLSLKGKD